MNLFSLLTLIAVPAGAIAGFQLFAPYGLFVAVVAAGGGAVIGRYAGPALAFLVLLCSQALAHLLHLPRHRR